MSLCRIAIQGTPSFAAFLEWNRARRPRADAELTTTVAAILREVMERGEEAALESAQRFDAPGLQSLWVSEEELRSAEVHPDQLAAIRTSIERVRIFHEKQLEACTKGWTKGSFGYAWRGPASTRVGGSQGYEGQRWLPLSRVGVYVPGGRASYPSSVIMNAVPAMVARVPECILTSPARVDGSLPASVLVAAREVGIRTIAKVGGAAAIGILATGASQFEPVDKIVGPGNAFVNEAKRQLWGSVGTDFYAGPSEVCVVIGTGANARFAAVDLLTQIEHAPDNMAILIGLSQSSIDEVLSHAEQLLRGGLHENSIRRALEEQSYAVVVQDEEAAASLVNEIAPEHLSLMVSDPERLSLRIRNAGSIAMGDWTPQSLGDFCAGPSHTLPTARAARFASPINVLEFLKVQSVSKFGRADLEPLLPVIEAFAEMEQFPMHGQGGALRG